MVANRIHLFILYEACILAFCLAGKSDEIWPWSYEVMSHDLLGAQIMDWPRSMSVVQDGLEITSYLVLVSFPRLAIHTELEKWLLPTSHSKYRTTKGGLLELNLITPTAMSSSTLIVLWFGITPQLLFLKCTHEIVKVIRSMAKKLILGASLCQTHFDIYRGYCKGMMGNGAIQ